MALRSTPHVNKCKRANQCLPNLARRSYFGVFGTRARFNVETDELLLAGATELAGRIWSVGWTMPTLAQAVDQATSVTVHLPCNPLLHMVQLSPVVNLAQQISSSCRHHVISKWRTNWNTTLPWDFTILAAGCKTCICFSIVAPSFVIVTSPLAVWIWTTHHNAYSTSSHLSTLTSIKPSN